MVVVVLVVVLRMRWGSVRGGSSWLCSAAWCRTCAAVAGIMMMFSISVLGLLLVLFFAAPLGLALMLMLGLHASGFGGAVRLQRRLE